MGEALLNGIDSCCLMLWLQYLSEGDWAFKTEKADAVQTQCCNASGKYGCAMCTVHVQGMFTACSGQASVLASQRECCQHRKALTAAPEVTLISSEGSPNLTLRLPLQQDESIVKGAKM